MPEPKHIPGFTLDNCKVIEGRKYCCTLGEYLRAESVGEEPNFNAEIKYIDPKSRGMLVAVTLPVPRIAIDGTHYADFLSYTLDGKLFASTGFYDKDLDLVSNLPKRFRTEFHGEFGVRCQTLDEYQWLIEFIATTQNDTTDPVLAASQWKLYKENTVRIIGDYPWREAQGLIVNLDETEIQVVEFKDFQSSDLFCNIYARGNNLFRILRSELPTGFRLLERSEIVRLQDETTASILSKEEQLSIIRFQKDDRTWNTTGWAGNDLEICWATNKPEGYFLNYPVVPKFNLDEDWLISFQNPAEYNYCVKTYLPDILGILPGVMTTLLKVPWNMVKDSVLQFTHTPQLFSIFDKNLSIDGKLLTFKELLIINRANYPKSLFKRATGHNTDNLPEMLVGDNYELLPNYFFREGYINLSQAEIWDNSAGRWVKNISAVREQYTYRVPKGSLAIEDISQKEIAPWDVEDIWENQVSWIRSKSEKNNDNTCYTISQCNERKVFYYRNGIEESISYKELAIQYNYWNTSQQRWLPCGDITQIGEIKRCQ